MIMSALLRSKLRKAATIPLLACAVLLCISAPDPASPLPSVRNLQQSSVPPRSNILFFVLDQWRYDWDGFHDPPVDLPFFREAAANGTRFSQAYVPSPLCAPSRACLASCKEYDEAGVLENHADMFPTDQTTFYRLLRDDAAYHTMTCGKDDLFKGDLNFPTYPGWSYERTVDLGFSDAIRSVGKTRVLKEHPPFDPYRTHLESLAVALETGDAVSAFDAYNACFRAPPGTTTPPPLCDASSFGNDMYPDNFVRDNAIRLLKRKPPSATDGGKPWFLQVNFPGPHPPIMSTATMASSVSDRTWPQPVGTSYVDVCPQQQLLVSEDEENGDGPPSSAQQPQFGGRCNYAAEIENIDRLMRSVVDEVRAQGELDETLVCIAGDHGEMLFDHSLQGKKVPWQGSVSVPLVCFGPGVARNAVYESPVTTLDVPGTFLDFAGLGTAPEPMTTKSLRQILEGDRLVDGSLPDAIIGPSGVGASGEDVIVPVVSDARAAPPPPRPFVSSGLMNWRLVVKETSDDDGDGTSSPVSYKLVCCRGPCEGTPGGLDAPVLVEGDWHMLLYDTKRDPFDLSSLALELPEIVAKLRPLLPNGWCPLTPE